MVNLFILLLILFLSNSLWTDISIVHAFSVALTVFYLAHGLLLLSAHGRDHAWPSPLLYIDYVGLLLLEGTLPSSPSFSLPSSSSLLSPPLLPSPPPPLSCFLDSVFLAAFYCARPLAQGLLPCARPTPLRMAYSPLPCAWPTSLRTAYSPAHGLHCARHTPLRMAYLLACVHSLAFHSSLLLCSIDDLGRYFSSKVYCPPFLPSPLPSLPSLTS